MSDFEIMVEDSPEMQRVINKAYDASLDIINKKMKQSRIVMSSKRAKLRRFRSKANKLGKVSRRIRKKRKRSLKRALSQQRNLKDVCHNSISNYMSSLRESYTTKSEISCGEISQIAGKRTRKSSFESKLSTEPSSHEGVGSSPSSVCQ